MPNYTIKSSLWNVSPYNYKQIISFPLHFKDLSLKNSENRILITNFLNKNSKRDVLNVEFWQNKLVLDNYKKNINSDFEKSFLHLFFLTKNNKLKNFDLKKYFFKNFNYFSEPAKNTVLKNY